VISFESEEFHLAAAKIVEDISKLVEAGFEYACDFDESKVFMRQK
jgi:hypothetical protein